MFNKSRHAYTLKPVCQVVYKRVSVNLLSSIQLHLLVASAPCVKLHAARFYGVPSHLTDMFHDGCVCPVV